MSHGTEGRTSRGLWGVSIWFVVGLLAAWVGGPVFAQDGVNPESGDRVLELERRLDLVAFEIERLRTGDVLLDERDAQRYGLGPSASAVYRSRGGVSIAGYGEMLYSNALTGGGTDSIDFLRAVVFVGSRLSNRITFNSELEFEHATTGGSGKVSVETAYLDFELLDALGIRAGLLLMPMGLVNEQHEPTIYLGTTRPATERMILPSTWRENGLGLFGDVAGFSYRAYVVNGMKGSGFGKAGLRNGRQNGSKAVAEDLAFVGRLDYRGVAGLILGVSGYVGQSGQGAEVDETRVKGLTVIVEGHADVDYKGLQLRGLAAFASIEDVSEINTLAGLSGTDSVGEQLLGFYVQAGYDVLRSIGTAHQLIPMVRYEWIDTQFRVPRGAVADGTLERSIIALGASYLPIPQVVIKVDYQLEIPSAEGQDESGSLNLALGYTF